MPRAPRGQVALSATVALAAALAVAAGARGMGGARVELEVVAVLPLPEPEGTAGLLLLREKGRDRILPLVVPDRTAFALDARPGRETLAASALDALGARVTEVELEPAEEAGGALVRLAQGNRLLSVPGPPGESVALALAAGVPIVVRRRVLDREGRALEDLEDAHREAEREAGELRL